MDEMNNGTLYIVATPIGNIEDMTGRAKRILSEVDIVASEDTRTTQKLFNILGIQNKTISNHKFNEKQQVDFLISALNEGKNIAIVSDAGTPCISDPGGVIVKAAAAHGIKIESIPGSSSVITALSICGMAFTNFSFYGFLPKEAKEIKKIIEAARKSEILVFVFFESPKRIKG
jgi:16S rRNA (cytidine1402-2'-O)-methyltransferase